MKNNELLAIIEGLLFISGDDGISMAEIQEVLTEEKPSTITKAINLLNEKYSKDESSAFSVQTFHKNKFRLQTKTHLRDYLAKLTQYENNNKLSNSVIEVLSIVAYRGPITKGEIDDLRNSDSAYQLMKLREKELIQATGKSEENPRANIYQITDNFFKIFNLNGMEDMPTITWDQQNDVEQQESQTTNFKDLFAKGESFDD